MIFAILNGFFAIDIIQGEEGNSRQSICNVLTVGQMF